MTLMGFRRICRGGNVLFEYITHCPVLYLLSQTEMKIIQEKLVTSKIPGQELANTTSPFSMVCDGKVSGTLYASV